MGDIWISYANGRKKCVGSIEEAEAVIEKSFPDATYGDWEQDSYDGTRSRCLVWRSDDEAENDDGTNAIAEIVTEEDEA